MTRVFSDVITIENEALYLGDVIAVRQLFSGMDSSADSMKAVLFIKAYRYSDDAHAATLVDQRSLDAPNYESTCMFFLNTTTPLPDSRSIEYCCNSKIYWFTSFRNKAAGSVFKPMQIMLTTSMSYNEINFSTRVGVTAHLYMTG